MNNEYAATAYAEHIGSQDDSRWVTQTKFYDPSQPPEVCTGNCTEAAFASLFGIGLDDVPSMQGLAGSDYWDALESFVRSRGYSLWMHPPSHYPAGLYLADGPSERGCGHFVVMRDGNMVHDPHPSRAGLLNVERVWSLMALDPAALSVQPSPGGQDTSFPWENFPAYLIDKCEGDTISEEGLQQALAAMAKDECYCLAARQPVGEPVVYGLRVKGTSAIVGVLPVELKDFPVKNAAWDERYDEVPLYAAPPAQAVDLEQFRPAVCAMGLYAEEPEEVDEAKRLLALIDSRRCANEWKVISNK